MLEPQHLLGANEYDKYQTIHAKEQSYTMIRDSALNSCESVGATEGVLTCEIADVQATGDATTLSRDLLASTGSTQPTVQPQKSLHWLAISGHRRQLYRPSSALRG